MYLIYLITTNRSMLCESEWTLSLERADFSEWNNTDFSFNDGCYSFTAGIVQNGETKE